MEEDNGRESPCLHLTYISQIEEKYVFKDETKAIEQLEIDILNKMEFLKILHKRVDNAIYEVTRSNSFLDEYKTINDINTV